VGEEKLGLGDAIIYATARKAMLLTGDSDFEGRDNVISVR